VIVIIIILLMPIIIIIIIFIINNNISNINNVIRLKKTKSNKINLDHNLIFKIKKTYQNHF